MPNRMIREGILSSERVDRLSLGAEVFYRRLMSVVDDYGRHVANHRLLLAACYPLRTHLVTPQEIGLWLVEMEDAELVTLYAVNDRNYLELRDFGQRMRAMRSKIPPPTNDGHMTVTCQSKIGDSPQKCLTHDGHMTVTCPPEVEREEEVEEKNTPPLPPVGGNEVGAKRKKSAQPARPKTNQTTTESIYALYPRKVAKGPALKAIERALTLTTPEALTEAVTAYAAATAKWPADRRQYIPHPASWFNGRRWEDDRATWADQGAPGRTPYNPYTDPNSGLTEGDRRQAAAWDADPDRF